LLDYEEVLPTFGDVIRERGVVLYAEYNIESVRWLPDGDPFVDGRLVVWHFFFSIHEDPIRVAEIIRSTMLDVVRTEISKEWDKNAENTRHPGD